MGAVCASQKTRDQPYLNIIVHMWKEKDKKYALFDYTHQDSHSQNISTMLDVRLCKYSDYILPVEINKFIQGTQELLVIENQKLTAITEVWNIIRQQPVLGVNVPNKVEIKLGQKIRLGRVKILLQEVSFTNALTTEESEEQQDEKQMEKDENEVKDSEYACRFCMSKVGTKNNPLVNPCICSGSVKYIHIKCLQQWINNKIKTRELNNIILYYWNTMTCEICKTNYKLDFKFHDRRYSVLDIPKPKEAYIMFQISHIDKHKEQGLYVINISDRDSIKIGRIQDNDIRLQDISVSRNHALISIDKLNQKIYIEDQGSKFGTLIECVEQMIQNKSIFQIGNTVMIFEFLKVNYKPYELPSQYQIIDYKDYQGQQQQNNHIQDNSLDDVLINIDNQQQVNYLSGDINQ